MSSGPGGPGGPGGAASEEELQAAYEAELKRLRVEHLFLEHVVGMINLGMRRTGLAPGTEDERDPGQVRLAIEAIRPLMPLLEQTAPEHAGQIRAALSQLQLSFVKIGGQPGTAAEPPASGAEGAPEPEAPRSGAGQTGPAAEPPQP